MKESSELHPSLEVTFTPADFETLRTRDLSGALCVVFDILRATTTMTAALAGGAREIIPASSITEALEWRKRHPGALLAGERHGGRILAAQSGGVDFDLGNSPREFTPERVAGRTIITTTTNGTRALRACAGAGRVLTGCFLNLSALIRAIEAELPRSLIIVAAGTFEEAACEDTLAAGAVCDAVWNRFSEDQIVDSARIAREVFQANRDSIPDALARARNGRRLLAKPDLREDVAFSSRRDVYDFAMEFKGGAVRKLE